MIRQLSTLPYLHIFICSIHRHLLWFSSVHLGIRLGNKAALCWLDGWPPNGGATVDVMLKQHHLLKCMQKTINTHYYHLRYLIPGK